MQVLRLNQIPVLSWRLPLRWYRRLTIANAVAIWMLIVLGGLVRVTESGEGCGQSWPMCHGRLIPNFEYHELIEWNHRLFAFLVGWLMVATVGATLLWYRKPRRLMVFALLTAFTYLAQALLGAITVWLRLDKTWVAAHMGNSMLLMAAAVLLAIFARLGPVKLSETNIWLRRLALGTLVWTYLALFTGSAVVGAGAELACPAWPHCSDTQLLPATAAETISFIHRLAVGLSDVMLLGLGVFIWRTRREDKRLMRTTHVMAALYLSQVFLGAFTIWLGAPSALKGLHLGLAAATWAALVVMTTFILIGKPAPAGGPDDGSGEKPLQSQKAGWWRKALQGRWLPETIRNYVGLMRPGVIPLLLVPTGASMLIAAVQHPVENSLWGLMACTMLGGTLATGGAHTINQYLERDLDARMKRTKRRAIVTGQISPRKALWFGIGLTVVGTGELWLTVNPLAAGLALSGNLFYVFVYTMWLKRTTAQNIVIGGAAGSVPPLVGWAAVTGRVDLPAILFFAIIFFWTPAHFWALALVRHEDYEAAGVPMLPVVKGEAATRRSILLYAVLLVGATFVPFMLQALGWLYLVAAALLGWLLVRQALKLQHHTSAARAWRLFKFSNTYLAALYLVMVIDRLMALN